MSISSELTLLANTKESIRTSINNKGGSVGANDTFASYATAITNLPSGGDDSTLRDLIERDITSITIPSGTTTIGANAFYYCDSLTSVTFPSSVTSIGNRAFQGCKNLFKNSTLTIPSTITSIGTYAFAECNIRNIVIQNGITEIPQYAFSWNYSDRRSLYSIVIPNSVTSIGNRAFNGQNYNENLELTIPDSVATIGEYAFYTPGILGKGFVKKLTIGTGITSIGTNAFAGAQDGATGVLQTLIIKATTPPTIQTGQYSASFEFTSDAVIYVPAASVDTYKAATGWSNYTSRIVAIGDAITFTPTNGDPAISVKNYELTSANYVQSTDVPSTIKNGAGSLEICEGVTRIGTFAFQNGSSLTSVTLPSTLTRIDEAALMGCTSLTGITVNTTTPPTLAGAAFSNTNNCPIYVPAASVDTYKAASGWSDYASRIVAIPSPSITIELYKQSNPADWGEFTGCSETQTVDVIPAASSSSTFDSDIKAAEVVMVEDNNGNDVTSQCTFSSNDYYKWDSTQDPSYDGESEASYEWRLDTYIDAADVQNLHSATITATYGNLSDDFTIGWTTTSNCEEPEPEPEPDPEEPEE